MPGSQVPAGRYGRAGGRRNRWPYLAGAVLAALLFGGLAVLGYRAFGEAPIQAEQTGFRVLDPQRVRIEFTVTRDTPRRPVDCVVTARAASGAETGRREVYVPPGPERAARSTVLRTGDTAVAAEVYGCTYDVPPYLVPAQPPSG